MAEEVFDIEEEDAEYATDDDETDPAEHELASSPDMLASQRCYIVYQDNLQNLRDKMQCKRMPWLCSSTPKTMWFFCNCSLGKWCNISC